MSKLMEEFKAFALKGNFVDLAVAVILGLAFNLVVQSLVNDVVMPLVAAIIGQPDFNSLTVQIGDSLIYYGVFLTTLVNFLLIAFVLFMIVKAVNRATRRREEPPSVHECPFCKTNIAVTASRCPACTSELGGVPS
jgi:large conductance mechanosensitive channel